MTQQVGFGTLRAGVFPQRQSSWMPMAVDPDLLASTTFVWQPALGKLTLTVVAKATLLLAPGYARLADEQEPISIVDGYWDDNPARSLFVPSDLAPPKPRMDVVVVGHAYAPKGQRVRSLVARLAIGPIDKSIEVFADRALGADGALLESDSFAHMPIVYERTRGGAATWNPVGIGGHDRDVDGHVRVPNLQPVGATPGQGDPIGFGPISASWPLRTERLANRAGFAAADWAKRPLPDGFNYAFFNVAPPDQQLAMLPEESVLTLEHLSSEHPRLVTRLPKLEPRALLEGRAGREELAMRPDTIWIDADRGLATILFKAQKDVDRAEALPVRVTLPAEQRRAVSPVMPAPSTPSWNVTQPPFTPAFAAPANPPSRNIFDGVQPARRGQAETLQATPASLGIEALLPAVAAAMSAPAARPAPAETPLPVAAPALVPPPRMVSLATPSMPAHVPLAPATRSAESSSPWASSARTGSLPAHAESAALLGVTGASNAAADPNARINAEAARKPRRTAVELLWFDPDVSPRVRRKKEWKPLFDELKRQAIDPELDAPGAVDDVEERREMVHLLTRGTPSLDGSIERAVDDSIGTDGRFAPPLLLLSGELAIDFDDLEALKAAVAIATPHAGKAEDDLRVAIDQATTYLGVPGLVLSTEVATAMTTRIREAFATGKRVVPSTFLDTEIERTLLERRAYKKREVFGGTYLRGAFAFTGNAASVPTYLPESLTKKLPLFRRFSVRLLVEVGFQVDQFETDATAMRARALSRVVRGAT